jgi:hypothetical protein
MKRRGGRNTIERDREGCFRQVWEGFVELCVVKTFVFTAAFSRSSPVYFVTNGRARPGG